MPAQKPSDIPLGKSADEAKKIAANYKVSDLTFQLRLKLETGSPRLAYLNTAIIVGSAVRTDTTVKYDAYIVEQWTAAFKAQQQ